MNWVIDKSFSFEAGHRVWQQKLNKPHLSIETDCACKNLHGHSYELKVFLGSNSLDDSSMVTDFKNLNWVKKFLDDNLDHKFIIDINDPNFNLITGVTAPTDINVDNWTNLLTIAPTNNEQHTLHRGGFVLVNFCPTSENICMHLAKKFEDGMRGVAKVVAVELWETKKSHCRYELK